MVAYLNRHELKEGRILLYTRPNLKNPKWQARIRVKGTTEYKVISTKTTDLDEAKRFALNLLDDLDFKVRSGKPITSPTFKKLHAMWLQTNPPKAAIENVGYYCLPYFADKKLEDITSDTVDDFWIWRKQNFTRKAPKDITLSRERTRIKGLFDFGVRKGYWTTSPLTYPNAQKPKRNRRPTFTQKEWRTLTLKAKKWRQLPSSSLHQKERELAYLYFMFLKSTGIRIGEARCLQWQHLRYKKDFDELIIIVPSGKTGSRHVAAQPQTMQYLERLKKLYPDEPKPTDVIFRHLQTLKPVDTFKRAFNSWLEYSDVPINGRTIYSLRHYFATDRLINGVNPALLASNMGTSIAMIERHYGHIVNSELYRQLTKYDRPTKPTTS